MNSSSVMRHLGGRLVRADVERMIHLAGPSLPLWLLPRAGGASFGEAMARTGIQTEAVELLQFLDALQAVRIERALSIESVQNDAFQKIAERQVVVVGKRPQDLQDPLFHADAGLYALDYVLFAWYQVTNVPCGLRGLARFS